MAHFSQRPNDVISRAQLISRLRSDHFDVLIIGGGATGAGAALDAASRGLKTALIEAGDFSSGTSSRSTKLVHGGVRYLENAAKRLDRQEYQLVREALKERKLFLKNAPHLSRSLPILTPVYGRLEAAYYWMGLKVYDLIAGDASLGASEFIGKSEALRRFPMIKKAGLKGAVVYYDGQFDDARMNVTLILTALREGATALNYVSGQRLLKDQGQIVGAMVRDAQAAESFAVYAKVVVNATGIFADALRTMDDLEAKASMEPSQGSHVILSHKFSPPDCGLIIPKTKDGRVIFLLPWQGKTMAGTTDRPQEITCRPKTTTDEVRYILEHVQEYFDIEVKSDDVIATWSGLRPLVKPLISRQHTAGISRDHVIEISRSKLITIIGGKWTTYRKMAQDVIDTAIKIGGLSPKNPSLTKDMTLVGGRHFNPLSVSSLITQKNLAPDIAEHLAHSYGDRANRVLDIKSGKNRSHRRLVKGFPYIEAEVIYAVNEEFAVCASDVLARRMRLAFLHNQAARKALAKVVVLMAKQLHWHPAKKREEMSAALAFLDTMCAGVTTHKRPIPHFDSVCTI